MVDNPLWRKREGNTNSFGYCCWKQKNISYFNVHSVVTCKLEAVIRDKLSVDTVRMALLPENCMSIWPKTAETPLHGGWWRQEPQLLHRSVIWMLSLLVYTALTLLVFSKDFTEVLSHSLLIASLHTNTDLKSRAQAQRCTFVKKGFCASCDSGCMWQKEENHISSSQWTTSRVTFVPCSTLDRWRTQINIFIVVCEIKSYFIKTKLRIMLYYIASLPHFRS